MNYSIMPKFFLPNDSIPNDSIPETLSITGSDAHHLAKVLRIRIGENLCISDMRRRLFSGKVISVSEDNVTVAVESVTEDNAEPSVKVTSLSCCDLSGTCQRR